MTKEKIQPNKVMDLKQLANGIFAGNESFEAIHIIIEAGKNLPPHHAKGTAIVQCLSGKGSFIIGAESQALTSGKWIYMPPKTEHAVKAEEDLELLVIKILSDQ